MNGEQRTRGTATNDDAACVLPVCSLTSKGTTPDRLSHPALLCKCATGSHTALRSGDVLRLIHRLDTARANVEDHGACIEQIEKVREFLSLSLVTP